MTKTSLLLAVVLACTTGRMALAADHLRLAPDLSFTDDSSDRFPIIGEHLDDGAIGAGRATVVFFGAKSCWNTNREAERLVALYPRFRDRMRFVVVDVGHPSEAQRTLMRAHYGGSIPTLAIFDAKGDVRYAEAGETASQRGDTTRLATLLTRALDE